MRLVLLVVLVAVLLQHDDFISAKLVAYYDFDGALSLVDLLFWISI